MGDDTAPDGVVSEDTINGLPSECQSSTDDNEGDQGLIWSRCCDMTVHLGEDYGLGYLGQHGPYRGAWNMDYTVDWTSLLLRAVLCNRPPASGPIGTRAESGLRNVTGRRLRTHRDLGHERAADDVPTHLPEAIPVIGTQAGQVAGQRSCGPRSS
jgi:hypothetical protein